MLKSSYNYVVIEDDLKVCESLRRRMQPFPHWNCMGLITEYGRAKTTICEHRPHLVFMDYAIQRGNSFALLDELTKLDNYHPYIVFFTGYLNEKPEIAEGITNTYRVNKYLNKPVYEKLTAHLPEYIAEAEKWIQTHFRTELWIETVHKKKLALLPETIVCISQPVNPRNKIIHTTDNEWEIRANWAYCEDLAQRYNLDYFFANARYYLVIRNYITHIQRPNIWLKGNMKIPVTRQNWQYLSNP